MYGIVEGVHVEALSSVHHLADVESVKAQERPILEHLAPVAKLREEGCVRSVELRHPEVEAMGLEELPSLLSGLLPVHDALPFLANEGHFSHEGSDVKHFEDLHDYLLGYRVDVAAGGGDEILRLFFLLLILLVLEDLEFFELLVLD